MPATPTSNIPSAVAEQLTDDFKNQPYWWDASPLRTSPLPASPVASRNSLNTTGFPTHCDVVVVGAGYTGLCSALELSRGGRDVVVLDAAAPGAGCSTRNGGQIGTSIKPGFTELAKRYGPELGAQVLNDGHDALRWIGGFVERENIDCNYRVCGRFYGAHRASVYDTFASKLADQPPGVVLDADIISKSEQHRYIGSDDYYGGILYNKHSSLDPGKYHAGLLGKVLEVGATVIASTPVTAIETLKSGFSIVTAQGAIKAKNVVVATNGYSNNLVPWLRRRVIPIGSYIIATEPLPEEQMKRLIPEQRVITDSRNMVVYYRPSPDNKRLLFGARVSISETDTIGAIPAVHSEMTARFPELASTKVSHSWMGFVAYTFDSLPHLGEYKGLHFAMGYCGSGVSLSSYSGTRLAKQILGTEKQPAAFSQTHFPSRFYYRQKPWFLAPSLAWYRYLDSRG